MNLAKRSVVLGVAVAVPASLVLGPSAVASQSSSAPVPVIQEFNDVAVASDGSVRTLEVRPDRKSGGRATIRRLDAAGAAQPPIVFRDPDPEVGHLDGALTPDGGAVIFVTKGEFETEVVTAVDVSPTGVVSAPQPVAGPAEALIPDLPLIGPTGAVVAAMPAAGVVAFRPAGAAAFVPPIEIFNRDADASTAVDVAAAPDGGAAVLAYPQGSWLHPYVRRISPDGRLGPKIDLGFGSLRSGLGTLTFASNGDLGVVLHRSPTKKAGAQALFARIPAGSNQAAQVQRLPAAPGGSLERGFSFGLDAGPGGFAVLTGRGPYGLQLWTGRETLRKVATFRDAGPFSGEVVAGADGSFTTIWERPLDRDPETLRSRLVAARLTPDGKLGPVQRLLPAPKGTHSQSTYGSVALPDGRLALVYDAGRGSDSRLLGQIVTLR